MITGERVVHRGYTAGKTHPAKAPSYLWRLGSVGLASYQVEGYIWDRQSEWVTLWTAGLGNAETHRIMKGLVLATLAEAQVDPRTPKVEAVEAGAPAAIQHPTMGLSRGARPEAVAETFGWAASGLEEDGGPWPDTPLPHEGPSSIPVGYWASHPRKKNLLHETVRSWMRIDGGGRTIDEVARAVGGGIRETFPKAAPAFAGRKGGRKWAPLDNKLQVELRPTGARGTLLMELSSTLDPSQVRAIKGAIEERLYERVQRAQLIR